MKLYYDPASTTCRPIVLFAAEHELMLDYVHVDLFAGEHQGEAFLAINPSGQVPVLEDGDFRLTESSAILKYLAEKLGSPSYPAEPQARARVNEAMDWFNTNFYHEFGYGVVYPQVLPHYARGDAAARAEAVAWSRERAQRRLTVLDDRLASSVGPFLFGDEPTIADYFGACLLVLGELVAFDLAPWPAVSAWMSAMKARPAWNRVHAAFYGWRSVMQEQARLSA
jgi:glutathione S-transferase